MQIVILSSLLQVWDAHSQRYHDGKRRICLHKPMKAMSVADVLYSMRFSGPIKLLVVDTFEARSIVFDVFCLFVTEKWCGHCCCAGVTVGTSDDNIAARRIATVTIAARGHLNACHFCQLPQICGLKLLCSRTTVLRTSGSGSCKRFRDGLQM